MRFIQWHDGCGTKISQHVPCFGPPDSYYTLFGHELFAQTQWMMVSVAAGILLAIVLIVWRSRQLRRGPFFLVIIAPAIVSVTLFILLVYLWPVVVYY
ncbi:MAG: hypothetical protein AAB590_01935 [Patescibacteria group bacterium]